MLSLRSTLVLSLVVLLGRAQTARACSPGTAPAPTAIPRIGTTGVSTATSIVVVSPNEPFGVSVTANGQAVPVTGWAGLGAGADKTGGPTSFWQLRLGDSMLAASADYVVTLPSGSGAPTLTTFSTAPGYDKQPGTAPNIRDLHLWRVRYPVDQIASGNCVFAEYEGFLTVDYDPATIPNTAAGSIIYSFQLTPETGGTVQTFVYTGDAPYAGLAPAADAPYPFAAWQPDLDPTRRYCLGISAIGDGNLARAGMPSDRVCADVVQVSAPGAPPPPDIGNGGAPGTANGGAPGTANGGAPGATGSSGGGCSIAGAPPSWLAILLCCAAAWSLTARRRVRRA
jgi:hypothetical protein